MTTEVAPGDLNEPLSLGERALEIQKLTEEWLDLEYQLNQLQARKKAVIEGCREKTTKICKRIDQLKNEINAVKNGETVRLVARQTDLFGESESE
jgi:proline dehydrogenase